MPTTTIDGSGVAIPAGRSIREKPIFRWASDVLSKLAASRAWYQEYRATVSELDNLSNRELDDIGIARCDIPTIAMRSASAKQAN